MYIKDGWEWRINTPINFENIGDSKNFHKKFYGGEGYLSGGIKTNKPADIVVIGDSHARHYMEGLYKVFAKPNKLNLYSNSGTSCIMLPMFTRTTKGYDWDNVCPNSLKKGLSYVYKGENSPIVIISELWLYQISIADILDKERKRKNIKVAPNDIIEGIYKLKQQIGNSMLVVIGIVPGAGYNLYDIFTRPRPVFFTFFNSAKYLSTKPVQVQLDFNNKLKEASLKSGKFIFLDPHDILCKDEKCRNLDSEKHLIYSDAYHLSKYGSIEVIKGFYPKLIKLIK
jgi:hypothetical protein